LGIFDTFFNKKQVPIPKNSGNDTELFGENFQHSRFPGSGLGMVSIV
jgi:hypothetical protein